MRAGYFWAIASAAGFYRLDRTINSRARRASKHL